MGWMDSDGYMCFIPPNREKRYVNQEIHGDTRGYNTVEMIQVNFFSAANCSRSVGQTGEIDTSKPGWTMR
jgi:hypothetical protein